jgi:hypothetical protein
MDRRSFFLGLPFLAGLASCKKETQVDLRKPISKKAPPETPPPNGITNPQPTPPEGPNGPAPVETPTDCPNFLDLSKIEDITEERFQTALKVYGDPSSALLVISMPKYSVRTKGPDPLQSIFVLQQEGKVLAQKAILRSDVKSNNTLRPIFFDHLGLKNVTRLVLLFELGVSQKKYSMDRDLTFENQFRGKPAYGATTGQMSPLVSDFDQYQKFCDFLPQREGFAPSPDGKSEQMLSHEVIYRAQGGLEGCVITDLFGDPLSEDGKDKKTREDNWADIIQHPYFICYAPVGNDKANPDHYIRTFLRVS